MLNFIFMRVRNETVSLLAALAFFAMIWTPLASADPQAVTAADVEAAVPAIERYIERALQQWGTPGLAIGIVAQDRLIYAKGFGVRRMGNTAPVDSRTLFQIGSSTKAFLGVTEALLVADGRLDWNDRVIDHAPDFRLADPWVTREFTIRDLLAQRSGLPESALSDLLIYGYPPEQVRAALRHVAPQSSFRSTYAYQNAFHLVAEAIVADKEEAPDWSTVLQRRVLTPLGMRASNTTPSGLVQAANAASGHRIVGGRPEPAPITRFPYNAPGAGGLNSNIEDLSRWIRFHINGGEIDGRRLIAREALAQTYQPLVLIDDESAESLSVVEDATLHYATGWVVHAMPNGRLIEHGGLTMGFGAHVAFDPDRRFGVVVLTNLAYPSPDGSLAEPIGRYVAGLLQGAPPRDHAGRALARVHQSVKDFDAILRPPAQPVPPRALSAYIGHYHSATLGDIHIRQAEGGTLALALGPADLPARLTPWSGDIFRADVSVPAVLGPPGTLVMTTLVQFSADLTGQVTQLEWGGAPYFLDHAPFIRIDRAQ